jgi:hypothetical protein
LLVISFCTYTYSLYFGYTTIPNIPWFFCYQRITFLCIHTWHCLTSYHISKCYPFVRNIYLIFIYNHFVYGYIYIYGWQYTHPMISCMETSYDPILFPYTSQPCPCRHINAFRPRIAPVGAPPPFCTAFGVTCSRKNQGVLWAKQNHFRENID